MENPQTEETLGILFPEELVELIGLREGDVLDAVDTGDGIALRAVDPDLAERLRVAFHENTKYKVILQDLSKLQRAAE